MSSEPEGSSSEVALSDTLLALPTDCQNGNIPTASSSWDVPQSSVLRYEDMMVVQISPSSTTLRELDVTKCVTDATVAVTAG